jgi:ABC-2 type transport system ATP-binding protein
VLILDEPTIGLDPLQTIEIRDLVRALGRTHTILFSTHILTEAEQVCDRVIIIDRGKLIAMDAPQTLRDRLQRSGRLFVRVGSSADREAVREALAQVTAVSSVTAYADGFTVTASAGADVRARLAEAVVLAGWELLELRPLAMSLEDIFLELTTRIEAREAAANRPAGQGNKRSKRHV